MHKKEKNIEVKIYELLGIRTFRKMAFKFRDLVCIPLTFKKTKEERDEMLYNEPSNYTMKKGHEIQDLRDFKKKLLFNAIIHIVNLMLCIIQGFLLAIGNAATLFTTITILFVAPASIYCIMLQRYNQIRINQVIKKVEPREEAKKSELKEELIKEDSLLSEHTYKVVDERDKEQNVTFEELIENASYHQLKQYRDKLSYFKQVMEEQSNINTEKNQKQNTQEEQPSISIPLPSNKTLVLEFKTKTKNECTN